MSEYQATYDAIKDALDTAEFRQVFYEATLDAVKDARIRQLEAQLEAVRGLLPELRKRVRPHTLASENSDHYRSFAHGGNFVLDRIEAALKETKGD